ncbi:MAG: hypothetical protein GY801_35210, partial [bacterium]|nr:hypothetical protein [bacterium]
MKDTTPNMLGSYGSWAKNVVPSDVRPLSFLHPQWSDLQYWKDTARSKMLQLLAQPEIGTSHAVRIVRTYQFDGLEIEELSWKLPYGPETAAIFMKPVNSHTPLPGILGLHDHGGIKYFGKQKITRTGADMHPFIQSHQQEYYGG